MRSHCNRLFPFLHEGFKYDWQSLSDRNVKCLLGFRARAAARMRASGALFAAFCAPRSRRTIRRSCVRHASCTPGRYSPTVLLVNKARCNHMHDMNKTVSYNVIWSVISLNLYI